jgi:hypothetical protein
MIEHLVPQSAWTAPYGHKLLLSELSWPTFDAGVVWPEDVQKGRRVGFALCSPPGKPPVLVEVKQVGPEIDTERQLFEYAFHRGVPLVVLRPGQEWHVFVPGERNDSGERRDYKHDLLERNAGVDQVERRIPISMASVPVEGAARSVTERRTPSPRHPDHRSG